MSFGAGVKWRLDGQQSKMTYSHGEQLTLAISWEFSCSSYIWPLHWFRLLMAWQLDSERKHPENECFKSPRQKLQGSLRPSLRSPRTSALSHSRDLGDCYDQSTFEERGRAACSYGKGRDWWQPPWGPPACRSFLPAVRSWGLKQWSSVFPVQTNRSWVSCLVNYERKPSLYCRGTFTKKVIPGPFAQTSPYGVLVVAEKRRMF